MKIAIVLPLLFLALLAGCQSTPQVSPTETAAIVHASARLGVFNAVQQSPGLRTAFIAVTKSVSLRLAAGQFEPGEVRAAVESVMPPREALTPALNLFAHYAANEAPKDNRAAYVRPVAEAFRDGIQRGLE